MKDGATHSNELVLFPMTAQLDGHPRIGAGMAAPTQNDESEMQGRAHWHGASS